MASGRRNDEKAKDEFRDESSEESSVVSSTSSEESDSDDEKHPQEERTQNGATRARDLRLRLAAFLPRIEDANRQLDHGTGFEINDSAGSDEDGEAQLDDGEDERYIEMNLGLGVLEEHGQAEHADHDSAYGGSASGDEAMTPQAPAPQAQSALDDLRGMRAKPKSGVLIVSDDDEQ